MTGSIWERFATDPRRAENAHLRASDRDRDVVNDLLGAAYAEGRITPEEHDERTDLVARTRTLGELPALVGDLVATGSSVPATTDRHAEAARRYRKQLQDALWQFLIPTLICWTIYLASGHHGLPWPVFVMLGTGVNYVRLATSRTDTIHSIERSLEKKERKELEQGKNATEANAD